MGIVRRYFESELGTLENPQWEPVDDETVRRVFAGNFTDVERAMTDVRAGCVLSTGNAEYRRAEARPRMQLYTSRFNNKRLKNTPGLIKVSIAVGSPRWPVGYEWVKCRCLAPHGLRNLRGEAYKVAYLAKLDELGVEVIKDNLETIGLEDGGDRGIVLLCYEDVSAGAVCHRRMFADWWLRQTGEIVRELEALTGAAAGQLPLL